MDIEKMRIIKEARDDFNASQARQKQQTMVYLSVVLNMKLDDVKKAWVDTE